MDIQHLLNSKTKSYLGLYLIIGLVFFSLLPSMESKAAIIKLAVLDSGFCLKKLGQYSKNIKIHSPLDVTTKAPKDFCLLKDSNPRLHGQDVLRTLIKDLKPINKIEIYPIIIFNKYNQQNIQSWKSAIRFSKQKGIDFLLLAVGLLVHKKPNIKLTIPYFAAAPTVGGQITKSSNIWPQNSTSESFLIGSYFSYKQNIFINTSQLYQSKIHFYFPNSKTQTSFFKGSSYSVAFSMNRAIKLCENSFLKGYTRLNQCLKNKKRKLQNNLISF